MYKALVARVRYHIQKANFMGLKEAESTLLLAEAADAIEELQADKAALNGTVSNLIQQIAELSKPRWIPFETRPMDEEERQYYSEQYGYELADEEAVIYCSQLPEHGQEVLVCNKWGHTWIDTFDDDPNYGVGFETNGDMDGLVAWMPLPKPYEPPKDGEA